MKSSDILKVMTDFLANHPDLSVSDARQHAIQLIETANDIERMFTFGNDDKRMIDVTPESMNKSLKAVPEFIEKKYTPKDLTIDPTTAIHEEFIECCLCPKGAKNQYKSLTDVHFRSTHTTTREAYKALCGYDSKTRLMSLKNSRDSDSRIKAAQAKRAENNKNKNGS